MKTLYFEGAGMDFEQHELSDVCNYRIRTAFTNLEGKKFYIELGRTPRYEKRILRSGREKMEQTSEWALRIDHLFEIVEGEKDCENKCSIRTDWKTIALLDYTKEAITKWINENLHCDFETIEVLNMFSGYRVFADKGYNLMENHVIDKDLFAKRETAYNEVDQEYRIALNEKYSKIGLFALNQDSIVIRCYASEQALSKTNLPRINKVMLESTLTKEGI